jgi:putative transcriptional regulator
LGGQDPAGWSDPARVLVRLPATASDLLARDRMNYNVARIRDGRKIMRPKNPLKNPIAHVKEPLRRSARRGLAILEFEPVDVRHIRAKFAATRKEFAALIGISVETLRNWEEGRRRPHGPARALLRAIDADPFVLARVLNWHAGEVRDEPEEWWDE